MKINHHNYEEFFILYWDNELSNEQKKMVESFVETNKDLQEEFRLFGETRYTPDRNLVFEEKELLLINTNSLIDFSNYPEQLLSYVDNELDIDQMKALEKFAAIHPAVQQELTLLKKIKLQPESEIVFPDKSILYRREEKVRVIQMSRMRVAIAAALILVTGFVTIRVINNNAKGESTEIVSSETPETKIVTPGIAEPQLTVQEKNEPPLIIAEPVKKDIQKLPVENLIAKTIAITDNENRNNLPEEKASGNASLTVLQTNPKQPAETPFPESINIGKDAIAIASPKNNNTLFENSTVTERPSPSYAIYDTSDEPNEHTDKGGLKGLLRKATRVFERRTKIQATTDDDKLLLGVFAVSLK